MSNDNLDPIVYKVGERISDKEVLRQNCLSDLDRFREDAGILFKTRKREKK